MNIRTLFLCLFLVTPLFLAPTVVHVQAQVGYTGGTLIYAMPREPSILRSLGAIDVDMWYVQSVFGGSLVLLNAKTEFEPWLAKSWELSEDGLTYTFHLREDVTWHDGVPFTSADVEYTHNVIDLQYDGWAGSTLKRLGVTVETPDDYTVIFRLPGPQAYSPLFESFDQERGQIFPKHIWDHTVNPDAPENPKDNPEIMAPYTGIGPYKFVEWVLGSHMTFERNENFWLEGMPYLDKIIFKFIVDSTARVTALELGEVDVDPEVAPYDALELQKKGPEVTGVNIVTTWAPAYRTCKIQMNWDNDPPGPVSDIRVRRAICHAMNRTQIVDLALFGFGEPNYYPRTHRLTELTNSTPGAGTDRYEYNITRAEELLEEAGYPKGPDGVRMQIEMLTCERMIKQAEIIRDQLREAGISIIVKVVDRATQSKMDDTGQFQMSFRGPSKVVPFPEGNLMGYLSPGIQSETTWTGFSNSTYDELMLRLVYEETDPEVRRQLAAQAQEILVQELPVIDTVSMQEIIGYRTDFEFASEIMPGWLPLHDVRFVGEVAPTVPTEPTLFGIPVTYFYVIIGVVVVAGLVGVFWIRRRRR